MGRFSGFLVWAMLVASPALAATGPFLSLRNTDFVVLVAFALFIGTLVYLRVPSLVMGLLDRRAEGIRSQLDEARVLREEAQALLASFERRQREVAVHAEEIVKAANADAQVAAEKAREELEASVARRIAAAQDRIASAEAAAVKEVRDQAAAVAVAVARDVIAGHMPNDVADALVEASISEVEAKLY